MFIFYNEVKPNNVFNWVSQRDTIISTPESIV